MQELADRVGASVALFVVEGDAAVAIEMVVPVAAGRHIAFHQGERAPLERGAAAYALAAVLPPAPEDPEPVRRVREVGYAYSQSEVEAGAHAAAAPIPGVHPRACLGLITHLEQGPSTPRPPWWRPRRRSGPGCPDATARRPAGQDLAATRSSAMSMIMSSWPPTRLRRRTRSGSTGRRGRSVAAISAWRRKLE